MVATVTLSKQQRKTLKEDYRAAYMAAKDQKSKDEVISRAAASITPKQASSVEVFGYGMVSDCSLSLQSCSDKFLASIEG